MAATEEAASEAGGCPTAEGSSEARGHDGGRPPAPSAALGLPRCQHRGPPRLPPGTALWFSSPLRSWSGRLALHQANAPRALVPAAH